MTESNGSVPKPLEFELTEGQTPEAIAEKLSERFTLRVLAPQTVTRKVADSFDWRVYASGGAVTQSSDNGVQKIEWLGLRDLSPRAATKGRLCRFAWEFPESRFKMVAEQVLEMRALTPIMRLRSETLGFDLLDKREKITARVFIENHTAATPKGAFNKPLSSRIRIVPVKGYHKAWASLADFASAKLGLKAAKVDIFTEGYNMVGLTPLDYTSKIKVEITPEMPAETAVRAVLSNLVSTLKKNHAGTCKDLDSEYLHDFRVAVRRTRSALGQLKSVIPPAVLKRFRPSFDWLGQVTGPTRDLDVYLLKFEDYCAEAAPSGRESLEFFREFLVKRQAREQRALGKKLKSARYRKLIAAWEAALEEPFTSKTPDWAGGKPISEVASRRIWRLYRRALKEGLAISEASPADDLHELRKTCKKLRYTMEFFRTLYPAKEIATLIKALKGLQDNLGDFNDYEVHAHALRQYGQELSGLKSPPADTLFSMGEIAAVLERKQQDMRDHFGERFVAFATNANHRKFKTLFSLAKSQGDS